MNNTAIQLELHERTHVMLAAQDLVIKRLDAGDKVLEMNYDFTPHTESKPIAALAYSIVFSYAINNVGRSSYSLLKKMLLKASELGSEIV